MGTRARGGLVKFAPLRRPPLTIRAADGSAAVSPFFTGEEAPLCAWDQCDRPAVEHHHIIEPDASIAGPDGSQGSNVWFRSEEHTSELQSQR